MKLLVKKRCAFRNPVTNNNKNKLPQTSESQGLTKALTAIGVIVIIGIVVFYAKQRKK